MYVVAIPNRTSPPAILLRESYREGDRVKNRTLANLSAWPPERDRKSTRLNSSHIQKSRMPSSA